ncbi:MAG: transcriptional repressor LexA, partial [Armatimonadetes bacterium]|nr:transcriptional repressor LexA [Armatimonadota bacterium]
MLTKRRKQVLEFIKKYINKHDYAPSLEEIKKHLKLSSVSTAHHHVRNLQESGYLQKEYNQPRALAPTKEKESLEIPLLGAITAGQPIEAIEIPDETIIITKDEVGKSGQYYALRVVGNSMIDEGIFDGDIVVIRKQDIADNGQTVVAVIDENQATLKKLYREKNKIRLQPANPLLFPIYRKEVEIRGVVVKIIRNLETRIEKEFAGDTKYKRRVDCSWDYKGEKTKSYTHGLHNYPAMFIPQVARRL